MKVTANDLRVNPKKIIDAANRGIEVVIVFRGKPCAKLVSYQKGTGQYKANELFGIWKDNERVRNVDEYVRVLRNRKRLCSG